MERFIIKGIQLLGVLEVIVSAGSHGLRESISINDVPARFRWGFVYTPKPSQTKIELVYELEYTTDEDRYILRTLKKLGYDEGDSDPWMPYVLGPSSLDEIRSDGTITTDRVYRDYRYISFGSRKIYRRFADALNDDAVNNRITAKYYMGVHRSILEWHEYLLSKAGEDQPLLSEDKAEKFFKNFIEVFREDKKIAEYLKRISLQ